MSRRLIDLTEADLEALIDRRLAAAIAELRPAEAPALLDRQGLARELSCSVKHIDRLRAEGLPEQQLGDLPRFELPEVMRWLRARNGGQGLRVVKGGGE